MFRWLKGLGLILSLLGASSSQAREASSEKADKAEALEYLRKVRDTNVKRLQEIDNSLSRAFDDSKDSSLEQVVTSLKSAKVEHSLRQQFLDRLIFQVDIHFRGGDLRAFLEKSLNDMAKVDALSSPADSGLWKFLKFASDAIHRLPEQKENILAFLEGYMNRSVSHPIQPEEYLSARNYSNGVASESGSPLDREQVGAFADRRLEELQRSLAPSTDIRALNP